ncbi:N-acetylmuramoyl-L-alanine amidase [Lysinibacillus sp. FSL L8-0312]|uniref:N-acetylmuramoyl-L-alanine amidase n=1 Tax=Lysinibacillus sp. FSL L8-0312 TaxID=2921521 RepID=UPI0030F95805
MSNQGTIHNGASIYHYTQQGHTANEISYRISNNNQVSYHVTVDDKESIQAIPFNRNVWHCVGSTDPNAIKKGNWLSIGVTAKVVDYVIELQRKTLFNTLRNI